MCVCSVVCMCVCSGSMQVWCAFVCVVVACRYGVHVCV